MYQALYRKYRPSSFDDVVGQNVIIKTLKNAITSNRIAHAYLFTGPRGTGKTSTAKILAKTINCECLNDFSPCNCCQSCELINNKQTTDIVEIDAASNNGVDEIRELKSKVNLAPSNSKYKIYIIDEVHMLSTGAFNALLKTLEEPPAHIIFILATTEPHKIPQTILSRCQRFDFKKISIDDIKFNLHKICQSEKIDITDEALYEIAYLSDGGMRDSIGLLDQAISYSGNHVSVDDIHEINGTVTINEIYDLALKLFQCDIIEVLDTFEYYDDVGKNMIKLLEELVDFFKNVMIYKIDKEFMKESTYIDLYQQASEVIDNEFSIYCIRKIFDTINDIKNSDNEKTVLELNLIEMILEKKKKSVKNTQTLKQQNIVQSKDESLLVNYHNTSNFESEQLYSKKIEEKQALKDQEEKNLSTFVEVDRQLVQIRINNALALFDKKGLVSFKSRMGILKNALIEENFSKYASLILDGELKVFGKNYLVFLFQDRAMTMLFNQHLEIIDSMMNHYFLDDIKTVAVDLVEWNIIKEEFNSKKKNYQYIEESHIDFNHKNKMISDDNNMIETLFSDIIEYSN